MGKTSKTPHQPIPWPHGKKSKGPKVGPLINRPDRQQPGDEPVRS